MSPTRLALVAVSAFLVLFPLALEQPGWPAGLKADEPAYYLMAQSLARDGDLRCGTEDLRRLFDEFPYSPVHNLILMTDDGWRTVYFGKPYLFSLFAAPAARLFGASGVLSLNLAMLLGMAWLGARYLRRFNTEALATLFSAGFFLLSVGFAYVFWLHPEVFNMASVTVCLYLGLTTGAPPETTFVPSGWRRLAALRPWRRPWVRAALSGAALALAVYNKPMLAALGLPVLFVLARGRRLAEVGSWLAGAAASMGLAVGIALALTGHASAYLGVVRGGYVACSPDRMPVAPVSSEVEERVVDQVVDDRPAEDEVADDGAPVDLDEGTPVEVADEDPPMRSWFWIFRLPDFRWPEVRERVGYFLWGRHTGLFLYFPFSGLALVLFLIHGRRSLSRWAVLLSAAAVAVFFLLWIPFNWHGGGGFVGNRYFVNAYPAFLFLVTRIRPRWITVVGYALGGLLLGPTLFSPFGRAVPWPTLQAHVRNVPFGWFPLELSLKGVPGYDTRTWADIRVTGRRDVFLPRSTRAWIHGAIGVELWLRSPQPLESVVLEARSFAVPNEIVLRLGTAEERLTATDDTQRVRVELRPGEPDRVLHSAGGATFAYRLEVTTASGAVRLWTQSYPPPPCAEFPAWETSEESFFVGVELSVMGTAERLARDLYAVEWGPVRAPRKVGAGREFHVQARVRNASAETWPSSPPTRVHLSYRWETPDGEIVEANGLRTAPAKAVPPGGWLTVKQDVLAPAEPGRYVLALDPVYEGVAWFSTRNGGRVYRTEVEVVDAPPARNSL